MERSEAQKMIMHDRYERYFWGEVTSKTLARKEHIAISFAFLCVFLTNH